MSKNYNSPEVVTREILKLSTLTLYEIARDIQVSDKWKKFAFAVGFSTENVIMIEMSNNDRFPAENVMYHWFSKNPKVDDLARILCDLDLERPLYRLKKYMNIESFRKTEQRLNRNRQLFTDQDNVLQGFEETDQNDFSANKSSYQNQISNTSNTSNTSTSTSVPTTPEPGLISISRCMASESLNKELTLDTKIESELSVSKISLSGLSIIEEILNKKSTKYSIDEFNEDIFEQSFVGKFGGEFFKKLRGNEFCIKSFCLEKFSESIENQKRLYNNIWCLTNFRLYSLPLITGFCFFENHLFLLYPNCQTKSLFSVLHRSQKYNIIISLRERLKILQLVGKVLSFLHCSIPFGACHGNIISKNILIGPNVIQLSGFDKFYTEDPQYLKGFNQISNNKINKSEIKIEDFYKSDINSYLELICETFWNIQKTEDDSLVDEIKDYEMKINYLGWNRDVEKTMKKIIQKYTTDSKECPKVVEIVDELNLMDRLTTEPPSYNDIELLNDMKE